MKGIFTILNYYFSPGRRAAQWPLATAPAAVGDRNLQGIFCKTKNFSKTPDNFALPSGNK
jgi:hypothetical protein